jgi:hypothetical protein
MKTLYVRLLLAAGAILVVAASTGIIERTGFR